MSASATYIADKRAVLKEAATRLEAGIAAANARWGGGGGRGRSEGKSGDGSDGVNRLFLVEQSIKNAAATAAAAAAAAADPTLRDLDPVFVEQAVMMPGVLRQLLVDGADAESTNPSRVFRALQLSKPAYRAARVGLEGASDTVVQQV